jgi:hypothetical protein
MVNPSNVSLAIGKYIKGKLPAIAKWKWSAWLRLAKSWRTWSAEGKLTKERAKEKNPKEQTKKYKRLRESVEVGSSTKSTDPKKARTPNGVADYTL